MKQKMKLKPVTPRALKALKTAGIDIADNVKLTSALLEIGADPDKLRPVWEACFLDPFEADDDFDLSVVSRGIADFLKQYMQLTD